MFFFSLLRQGCFNSLLVLWRFQGIFGFWYTRLMALHSFRPWSGFAGKVNLQSAPPPSKLRGSWTVHRFSWFHSCFFAFAVKYGLYDYVLWFGRMIKLHDFDVCFLLTSKWLERNYWIVGWNVWLVVLFPKFFGEVGAKCPASEKFYNMSNAGSEWPNAHNPLTSSALMIANLEMLPSISFFQTGPYRGWNHGHVDIDAYAERPNRWKQRNGF